MSRPQDQPKELNPTQLIILTFAAACIAGGLLLEIPIATHEDVSFIDAVFFYRYVRSVRHRACCC